MKQTQILYIYIYINHIKLTIVNIHELQNHVKLGKKWLIMGPLDFNLICFKLYKLWKVSCGCISNPNQTILASSQQF